MENHKIFYNLVYFPQLVVRALENAQNQLPIPTSF